jgi:hypothetical protein
MANYKLIEETIEMFDKMDKHKRFDMDSWTHSCGAPSCIAGYVVANQLPEVFQQYNAITHSTKAFTELLDANLITDEAHEKLIKQLEALSELKLGLQDGDNISDIFPAKASELFEIDISYADGIFWPGGKYWDELDGTKPKHAVKALKRLVKDLKDNGEPDTSDDVAHQRSIVSGMSLV